MSYENMNREELIYLLNLRDQEIKDLIEKNSLDELTKVFNRKTGINKLNILYQYSLENNKDISVCFIDVDNLKVINDSLGHRIGDEALIRITSIIKSNIRKNDFIFRYGGDEFIIIFPGASKKDAKDILNRICENIKEENNIIEYELGLSYGICSFKELKECPMSFNDLIVNADTEMYMNKSNNLHFRECKLIGR